MKLFQLAVFIFLGIMAGSYLYIKNQTAPLIVQGPEIRYVPIGDSYTIGDGVSSSETYPELLTNHLRQSGYNVKLVLNPAQSGWTTQDAIDDELPIFVKSKPTFATLLIGANDYALGIDNGRFRNQIIYLLDHMLGVLPDRKSLILITIPDYSVTKIGQEFGDVAVTSAGIAEFNNIITEEGEKRGLPVVDIFTLTQQMGADPTLVNPDGLHPSAKEYVLWEREIYPHAVELLRNYFSAEQPSARVYHAELVYVLKIATRDNRKKGTGKTESIFVPSVRTTAIPVSAFPRVFPFIKNELIIT